MTFRCGHCGAQYASSQTLRDGRVYQARCPSCGHLIRLKSPGGEARSPGSRESRPLVPEGAASAAVPGKASPSPSEKPLAAVPPRLAEPEPPATPSPSTPAPILEVAAPPAARSDGSFHDLFLDDSEPPNPPAARANAVPSPPEPVGPGVAARGGAEGGRRKVGMGLAVGGVALAVLFAAVGALALRRPAKEEAPVSRALLPRAEWATSETKRAGPSEEFLEELEAEERQAAEEGRPAPVRQRPRSAGSPAKRQPRQTEAAARALNVPVPPVPAPEPPAAPPSMTQPVAPPPQPVEVAPAPPPPQPEREAPAVARSSTAPAAAGTDARVDFAEGMSPPVFVSGPEPEYTARAIDRGVEGLMVVRCVVTAQGTVHGCQVLRSLPFMDQAVVEALERRRYKPAALRGRPVEVNYTFRIKLALPR